MGIGDLSFLSQLPAISRADARLDPKSVRFQPEIEPLVRLLEETPRERLLEEVAARIKQGLNYRELLAALLLAGVRNIQPRPVGFKFHAVLVVNSAHLASLASPDSDRWLPIFWALDYFKESQARDVREGDWTMGPVNESAVPRQRRPGRHSSKPWTTGTKRPPMRLWPGWSAPPKPRRYFEDFLPLRRARFPRHRPQGHLCGQQLAYAATHRLAACRAGAAFSGVCLALSRRRESGQAGCRAGPSLARNQARAARIRSDWQQGKTSVEAAAEMLATLREASERRGVRRGR